MQKSASGYLLDLNALLHNLKTAIEGAAMINTSINNVFHKMLILCGFNWFVNKTYSNIRGLFALKRMTMTDLYLSILFY